MAKLVFCLVLSMLVVAAHARLIPDDAPRYQTSHQQGRLVSAESFSSFGSTEVLGENYQTSLYDESSRGGGRGEFDRMQEDTTSTLTNSFPNSFADADNSLASNTFSTESTHVDPAQGVRYNYADSVNTQYERGLARRGAGAGSGEAASFTLEGNTEKTDSAEWTESEP